MIAAAAALVGAVALAPTAAAPRVGQPAVVAPRAAWSSARGSVWIVPCKLSDGDPQHCVGLETRRGPERRLLGQGYLPGALATGLLWSRRPGVSGPDVVAAGSPGGSNGCLDVFAVTFGATLRVQKLHPCYTETPRVTLREGRAAVDLSVSLGGVSFGGSNASTASVPVPAIWDDSGFTLDLHELRRRSLGAEDGALHHYALETGLEAYVRLEGDASGNGVGLAVQALAGRMLYGRADEARDMLRELWPRQLNGSPEPGRERFWSEVCRELLRSPLWPTLDLDRLPHADLIRTGAGASPSP